MEPDQEVGRSKEEEDDQDWLGSQLDQESFADQTLTYCILKDLEDQQRVVNSHKEGFTIEDDFLEMEDDFGKRRRRPMVDGDQMSREDDNTNTSTDEAGETGQKETILGQDGGVDTGENPTNPSATTKNFFAVAVFLRGTTVDHNDGGQYKSSCHDRQFVDSAGTRRLPDRNAAGTIMTGENLHYTWTKHRLSLTSWIVYHFAVPL